MVLVNVSIYTIAHEINNCMKRVFPMYNLDGCRLERERGKRHHRYSTNQLLHSLTCIFGQVHDDYDHENEATTTKLFIAVCLILSVTELRAIAGFYTIINL